MLVFSIIIIAELFFSFLSTILLANANPLDYAVKALIDAKKTVYVLSRDERALLAEHIMRTSIMKCEHWEGGFEQNESYWLKRFENVKATKEDRCRAWKDKLKRDIEGINFDDKYKHPDEAEWKRLQVRYTPTKFGVCLAGGNGQKKVNERGVFTAQGELLKTLKHFHLLDICGWENVNVLVSVSRSQWQQSNVGKAQFDPFNRERNGDLSDNRINSSKREIANVRDNGEKLFDQARDAFQALQSMALATIDASEVPRTNMFNEILLFLLNKIASTWLMDTFPLDKPNMRRWFQKQVFATARHLSNYYPSYWQLMKRTMLRADGLLKQGETARLEDMAVEQRWNTNLVKVLGEVKQKALDSLMAQRKDK